MKLKAFIAIVTLLYNQNSIGQSKLPINQLPPLTTFTNNQDHDNMKEQLGIVKLRPGKDGNEKSPNAANYDESLANPCPTLPDILTLNNGKKINTKEEWWKTRRPEIVEEFEREIYGKLPKNIPSVKWTVKITDREFVNRTPVIAKEIIGQVDNSSYPLIDVNIKMVLVVPTNVKGPVPVLMMFGRPSLPAPAQPAPDDMDKINDTFKKMMIQFDPAIGEVFDKYPAYQPITRLPAPNFFAPPKPDDQLTPQERLLAAGWGY
ncbi:MAG TPA: acetylxylan esterase, partial [Saprospiraceae bacterium]|nr:acetylxylan esterase [Saprospiraceae bacterium]